MKKQTVEITGKFISILARGFQLPRLDERELELGFVGLAVLFGLVGFKEDARAQVPVIDRVLYVCADERVVSLFR